MARRRSLAGSLGGSLAGSLSDRSAGGAAVPATGLLPDVQAASGQTARAAWWLGSVNSAYTGPLIRIVRASDSAELDIYAGETLGSIDEAAITAHCTGTNGFVVTWYDQSGNGNDITQATSTRRPKIYDSATGLVKDGNQIAMLFVRTNPADYLSRADNCGFGSDPSITTFWAGSVNDAGTARVLARIGGTTRSWSVGLHTDDTWCVSNSVFGPAGNSYRLLTPAASSANYAWYTATIAAWAYPGTTSTVRQNGVLLTESAAVGATAVSPHVTGAYTGVGAAEGGGATTAFGGLLTGVIHFEGVLQEPALTVLAAFGDTCVEAAEGAAPSPADLSLEQWHFVVSGQSNADQLAVPGTVPSSYGDSWTKVSQGGTPLSYWSTGGAGFDALVARINALDPGLRIVQWFIQGEADLNETLSADYGARRIQAHADLEAATGRTIYVVESLIHDDVTTGGEWEDTLNVQKGLFAAEYPDRVVTCDPTPHGSLSDGVHWDAALRAAMPEVARALARTTWG